MNSYLLNVYNRSSIKIVRGDGVYLYDDFDKRYLDFTAGIATVSLGHSHPYLIQKLNQQSRNLWHASNLFTIPQQGQLAERLTKLTFADKVFFCSSGLEATEAAIKLIRRYHYIRGNPKRNKIITIDGGFHGRSIAAISAGGSDYAKEGYQPLLAGFVQVPRNDIAAIEKVIDEDTAGVFLELVQSEGGVYPLDVKYLTRLRQLTRKEGILLAIDEVQTGYGRTGSLFYHQKIGLEPDLMTLAKAMGNGFPLGACLVTEKVADVMKPGTHGSTYGGNPLAMTVGNAVLDIMTEKNFFPEVNQSLIYLHQKLDQIQENFPDLIKEVRKVGLLIGVEFYNERVLIKEFLSSCLNAGLLLSKTANPNTVRIIPPLIITKDHIRQFIELFSIAIRKADKT